MIHCKKLPNFGKFRYILLNNVKLTNIAKYGEILVNSTKVC